MRTGSIGGSPTGTAPRTSSASDSAVRSILIRPNVAKENASGEPFADLATVYKAVARHLRRRFLKTTRRRLESMCRLHAEDAAEKFDARTFALSGTDLFVRLLKHYRGFLAGDCRATPLFSLTVPSGRPLFLVEAIAPDCARLHCFGALCEQSPANSAVSMPEANAA